MITYHDDGSLRDELGQVWAWAETDAYGKSLAAAFNRAAELERLLRECFPIALNSRTAYHSLLGEIAAALTPATEGGAA